MNRTGTFCHDSLPSASAGLARVVSQFEFTFSDERSRNRCDTIGSLECLERRRLRKCFAKMAGCGGVTFVSLLACAEQIETYLIGTAAVWFVGGPIVAMAWAYEHFCYGGGDDA
jgi:hypothetical protein